MVGCNGWFIRVDNIAIFTVRVYKGWLVRVYYSLLIMKHTKGLLIVNHTKGL